MFFQHHADIWREFPGLVPGVLTVRGVSAGADVTEPVARFQAIARERLQATEVSAFPEIQAWRRAFSQMGLKPTQYRSASEALLRRFSKEGDLPSILPLIDLCNAVSLAFAIPVAVIDLAGIEGDLIVRHATGDEISLTFGGETEHPASGEVIFADTANRVHARRWCNRQTGYSAVRPGSTDVLIVSEAMHEGGREDMERLMSGLAGPLRQAFGTVSEPVLLTADQPRFEVGSQA
jgi:DNA/RNA-binding domain of Phe-tRNA-synthetase-like protein